MKNFVFLLLIACCFAGGHYAAGYLFFKKKEVVSFSPRFQPSPFPLKNQKFAVVVIGCNNGASVGKTLLSIFSQNYPSYRLIYVDDASDDGSFELVRDLVGAKAKVIRNEKREGSLASISKVVRGLDDDEIVVVVQGQDLLSHEWVLQRLNAYYANADLWMTYGKYKEFPSYETGLSQKCDRQESFSPMHLTSFYAALFKQIREADFMQGGQVLPACAEMAYMVPMLEMADGHAGEISEVLYIMNAEAKEKKDREMELICEKFIRALDPYAPLSTLKGDLCSESF